MNHLSLAKRHKELLYYKISHIAHLCLTTLKDHTKYFSL